MTPKKLAFFNYIFTHCACSPDATAHLLLRRSSEMVSSVLTSSKFTNFFPFPASKWKHTAKINGIVHCAAFRLTRINTWTTSELLIKAVIHLRLRWPWSCIHCTASLPSWQRHSTCDRRLDSDPARCGSPATHKTAGCWWTWQRAKPDT